MFSFQILREFLSVVQIESVTKQIGSVTHNSCNTAEHHTKHSLLRARKLTRFARSPFALPSKQKQKTKIILSSDKFQQVFTTSSKASTRFAAFQRQTASIRRFYCTAARTKKQHASQGVRLWEGKRGQNGGAGAKHRHRKKQKENK